MDVIEQLITRPLSDIERVRFYKRDDITTDLICCEVKLHDEIWTFHEDLAGWQALVEHLAALPGFRRDWFAAVSQPPFARSETLAFQRA